jgi:hypothetical protein
VCDKDNIHDTNVFEWNTFSSKFEASPLAFKELNLEEIKNTASFVGEATRRKQIIGFISETPSRKKGL